MARYFLVSVLCLLAFLSYSQSTDELDSYLNLKFANFANWTRARNLDPSPQVVGPTPMTASNTHSRSTYNLRHHGIQNHSNNVHKIIAKDTDLTSYLRLSFLTEGTVQFGGEYTSDGTVWTKNISAQGTWYVTIPSTWFWNVTVEFTQTSIGYIDITSYTQLILDMYADGYEVYFQNLWQTPDLQDFEHVLKDAVFQSLRATIKTAAWAHPIKDIYQKYFLEILTEERWENIVGPGNLIRQNEFNDNN